MVTIELNDDEAKLFLVFRKRQDILSPILGYMDALNLNNLFNVSITMDTNDKGLIVHTAITKHFR